MHTELVTSFSLAGAAFYGRRCVESAVKHWPFPMVVYADAPMTMAGVEVRTTGAIPGWCETWEKLPSTRPDARRTGSDEWTRKPDSYLWNGQRFAVKPFVWHDSAVRLEQGLLVWLDADTVTKWDVPADLVERVIDRYDVAYLGRGSMHPENGIVVFRIPEALPLLRWCRDAYQQEFYRTLNEGWTDCHVLRAGLQAVPVRARDLTSHTFRGAWTSSIDAVAMSPFGPYVTHLKGTQRKREHAA